MAWTLRIPSAPCPALIALGLLASCGPRSAAPPAQAKVLESRPSTAAPPGAVGEASPAPPALPGRKVPPVGTSHLDLGYPWDFWTRDGFERYSAVEAGMGALASADPERIQVTTVGHSVEGRPLWVMRVCDGPVGELPEMVLAAGIHGHEGSELDAMFMLETLLRNDGDPAIAELLRTRVLWVMPMINPDGIIEHERLNANGVDLNRNFGGTWIPAKGKGSRNNPGPEPFSEPESRALRDLLQGRPQLNVHADLHRSAWMVIVPPVGGSDPTSPAVLEAARALDRALADDPTLGFQAPFRVKSQGGFTIDWVWKQLGVMAFTLEFHPSELVPLPDPPQDPRYRTLLHLLNRCGQYAHTP